jgi:hypothetical protein
MPIINARQCHRRPSAQLDHWRHRRDETEDLEGPDEPDVPLDADTLRRLEAVRAAKQRAGRDLTDAELDRLL